MQKKILIIDDSEYKIQKVQEVLVYRKSKDVELIVANSYNSGMRKLILEGNFDGLILDMGFPHFDGEHIKYDETKLGLFVLREMKRKKVDIPVIVYSSDRYEEVFQYPNVKDYILNGPYDISTQLNQFLDNIQTKEA